MNPKQITLSILEGLVNGAPEIEDRPTREDISDLRSSRFRGAARDRISGRRVAEMRDRCRKTKVAVGSALLSVWIEKRALETVIRKIKALPLKAWQGCAKEDDWTFLY